MVVRNAFEELAVASKQDGTTNAVAASQTAVVDAVTDVETAVGATVTRHDIEIARLDTVIVRLTELRTELEQKLERGQEIELAPTTLTALEQIIVTVQGTVEITNDTGNALPTTGSVGITGPVTVQGPILTSILSAVDGLETLLASLDSKDFATRITLSAAVTELTSILGAVNQGNAQTDGVETLLQDLRSRLGDVGAPADPAGTALAVLRQLHNDLIGTLDVANPNLDIPLSTLRGAPTGTIEAVRTILAALNDTHYRRTDSVPPGTNLIGNVGSITGTKAGQGRFFVATSGRLSLTLSGNVRGTLTNPVGSGKTVILVRVTAFTTQTGWVTVFINPTAGVPGAGDRPRSNAILGGGTPAVATLRIDTNATTPLSGGIDPGWTFGLPANSRSQLDMPPLIIAPGVTLGINIPFAGAGDATMGLYWYEDG